MHTRNPLNLGKDTQYYGNVRQDVIKFVREAKIKASRVIELGCSSGKTGAELKTLLGADQYVGVEKFKDAADQAATRLDAVHVADLDTVSHADLGLGDEHFDLLVALDVLEHLYDPWSALARWGALIAPGGHLVTSIPNVQNIDVLAMLAHGSFAYQKEGLLDATHIRFFTRASIADLLAGADFTDATINCVFNRQIDLANLQPTGNSINLGRLTIADLTREQAIELFTFQYLVLARKN
jgi:trans-aconitate methyltransferase